MTIESSAMLNQKIAALRDERAAAIRDGVRTLEVALIDRRLKKLQRDRQRLNGARQ